MYSNFGTEAVINEACVTNNSIDFFEIDVSVWNLV